MPADAGSPAPEREQPSAGERLNALACKYYQQGKYSQAESLYRRATEVEPDRAVYHHNRANALVKLNRLADARHEAERATRLEPREAASHALLTHILLAERNYQAAERSIQRAIQLDPRNPSHHRKLGAALYGMRRYGAAESIYRGYVAAVPSDAEAHADLAGLLLAQGKKDDARAMAAKAMKLGLRSHWVFERLGLASHSSAPRPAARPVAPPSAPVVRPRTTESPKPAASARPAVMPSD